LDSEGIKYSYFTKKVTAHFSNSCPLDSERKRNSFRKVGKQMPNVAETENTAISDEALDKEIADVLIAISVISRQLAKKITIRHKSKEVNADGK
jgi:hypothetical protein